ncbi:MAG: DUF402 domain-containing protein [Acidimicrobiales bacterium]
MEYTNEKWGGKPHYRGVVHVLGEDEFGTWLWGPGGRTIYRGDEVAFIGEYDTIILVPTEDWWTLSWPIAHPRMTLYVNISTPAIWEKNRVVCIDLDLDVVQLIDGSVLIVDEDEFAEHQVLYDYPQDIIDGARKAADTAYDLAVRQVPPFDGGAAKSWAEEGWERTRSGSL